MIKVKKVLPWVLTLTWMAVIFFLSHQPATQSANLSSGVMEQVLKILEKVLPNAAFDSELFHYVIRKGAHFFAYLVLGILVTMSLKTMDHVNLTGWQLILLAVLICVLYATSDEIHQIFIPGRAGQIKDVLIDSAGSMTGIALIYHLKN